MATGGMTPLRPTLPVLAVGTASILVLLVLSILVWQNAHGSESSPPPVRASSGPVASTPPSTPPASTAPQPGHAIQLETLTDSARPHATVHLDGRYVGAVGDAMLRVQRLQNGRWVDFPLPTAVGGSGRFSAYVELGQVGLSHLRVVDSRTGAVSNVVTVTIE